MKLSAHQGFGLGWEPDYKGVAQGPMDREASQAMVPGSQTDGQLFSTSWTVACQALLSMRFPRQEYWSELLFPSPGDLPDPGVKPASTAFLADSLPLSHWGNPTMLT